MTLRSVNPYTSYQVLLDLQRTKEHMATLTEQIASGNRLTKLGDDPTASALVLNFQNSIGENKAYIKQADSAASFLQITETALQAVSDSTVRLQELGGQALGAATTPNVRAAIAAEVSGIMNNLVSLANTQTQGKYIFAGTKTTVPPFDATGKYTGNHNPILLDVSTSTTVQTNIAGDTAFLNGDASIRTATEGPGSTGDIFLQISDLVKGLTDPNMSTGADMIQKVSKNLNTILGNVSTQIADLGGRQASLLQLKDNMDSYNLSLKAIQDSYQALDYPTAMSEFSQAQIAQQASLSMLGKANNLNLFNYLA